MGSIGGKVSRSPRNRSSTHGDNRAGRRVESFTGQWQHTLDAKGRLIVPSRIRDELEEDTKVTITVWPEGCLSLWGSTGWAALEAKLVSLRTSNPQARKVIRGIANKAHRDVVDKQGRITVPPLLREWAGITKEVVISGAFDHAEIWAPERFEAMSEEVTPEGLAQYMDGLEI